jgi:DNA-binding transcriptional LysR family regulator
VLDDRMIDLVEEGIDVSLRLGPLPDSTAVARRIATGPRSVMASRGYLERFGEPRTPAELSAHQAVIYTRERISAWTFSRASSEVSVAVSGRLRVSSAEGLRAAVLAGMGLAIASHWMFAPEIASGQVRPLLADWALSPMDLWAVYPTGRLASTKARAFVDHIAKGLEMAG